MRIIIPLTGEMITVESGNPDNPVKPIDLHKLLPEGLDNFAWQALRFDFEAGIAELEVTFEPAEIPTILDPQGIAIESRLETEEEFTNRRVASEVALRQVLRDNTIDKLYEITGEPKLIGPPKMETKEVM